MFQQIKWRVVTFVVTRRDVGERKTANSLRISGLLWCHQNLCLIWNMVDINKLKVFWRGDFTPLTPANFIGFLHYALGLGINRANG